MTDTLLGNLTPVINNALDSGLTVGTRIKFTVDRTITKVRWFFPTPVPSNTVPWAIWVYNPGDDSAGALLGTGSFSASPTPNAWNEISITPIMRSAADEIVVAVWSATRYVATLNFFGADVPSANGDLIGSAETANNRRNGRFRSGGSLLYPSDGSNKSCYFVDIEVEEPASSVAGEFQATAPAAVLAATGGLIDDAVFASTSAAAALSGVGALINEGAFAATGAASTLAGAATLINPGVATAGVTGFSLSAAGTLTNSGTFQATGRAAVLSATNVVDRPAVLTAAGSTSTLTAGGSTPALAPSGYP